MRSEAYVLVVAIRMQESGYCTLVPFVRLLEISIRAMVDERLSVATERTDACEVQHYFMLLSLRPHWIWLRPEIAVNKYGQISYNGSDWHGVGYHSSTRRPEHWMMTFDSRASLSNMKTYLFERVENTSTFLCTCADNGDQFWGLLVPKIFCSV